MFHCQWAGIPTKKKSQGFPSHNGLGTILYNIKPEIYCQLSQMLEACGWYHHHHMVQVRKRHHMIFLSINQGGQLGFAWSLNLSSGNLGLGVNLKHLKATVLHQVQIQENFIVCIAKGSCHLSLQNHRITDWIRLKGTTAGRLAQLPYSNRVISEHIAQDWVQTILEYLHGGRLFDFHRQYMPVHGHLLVLPHVQVELPVHSFWLLPLVLLFDTTSKRLTLSSLHPLFRYL